MPSPDARTQGGILWWGLVVLCMAYGTCRAEDYTVRFTVQIDEKRRGDFTVTVREKKAPLAAARFREMVHSGFFDGCSFFRVIPGFIVQFGLTGNVTRQKQWDTRGLLRDESHVEQPDWNIRGTIAFVNSGANSRGTQLFVNYDDNHQLDAKGSLAPVPFGRIVDGMTTLSAVYAGYRERPRQSSIRSRGDAYLKSEFPRLSYIVRAQQIAFVEEPFALSKNATGLLITFLMVIAAAVCCAAIRQLQRRAAERGLYGKGGHGDDDELPPGADDDDDVLDLDDDLEDDDLARER